MESYSDKHVPAVRDFNKRIGQKGVSYRLPESPVPQWLPHRDSIPLYQESFVALEGESVRGGYILKQQAFICNGQTRMIAGYQLPISEGVVNRQYTLLGR